MKKFQENEEVSDIRKWSKEEEWTDNFYEKTYKSQENGKFMGRLPFKSYFDSSTQLGSSFSMELKRLFSRFNDVFNATKNFVKPISAHSMNIKC